MKVRTILKKLQEDDWVLVAQKGSHRQFKHAVKPGKVTVAGYPSLDLDKEIVVSIYKQAGWEKDW